MDSSVLKWAVGCLVSNDDIKPVIWDFFVHWLLLVLLVIVGGYRWLQLVYKGAQKGVKIFKKPLLQGLSVLLKRKKKYQGPVQSFGPLGLKMCSPIPPSCQGATVVVVVTVAAAVLAVVKHIVVAQDMSMCHGCGFSSHTILSVVVLFCQKNRKKDIKKTYLGLKTHTCLKPCPLSSLLPSLDPSLVVVIFVIVIGCYSSGVGHICIVCTVKNFSITKKIERKKKHNQGSRHIHVSSPSHHCHHLPWY